MGTRLGGCLCKGMVYSCGLGGRGVVVKAWFYSFDPFGRVVVVKASFVRL